MTSHNSFLQKAAKCCVESSCFLQNLFHRVRPGQKLTAAHSSGPRVLTVSGLVLRRFQQLSELHVHMNFSPQEQGHLQQNQLQLTDTCTQNMGQTTSSCSRSSWSTTTTHWCGRWSRRRTSRKTFWPRGPAGHGWWRATGEARCSWKMSPASPEPPRALPWSSAPPPSWGHMALPRWPHTDQSEDRGDYHLLPVIIHCIH